MCAGFAHRWRLFMCRYVLTSGKSVHQQPLLCERNTCVLALQFICRIRPRIDRTRVLPKFHLARHVASRHVLTRHLWRVKPMHFSCVELVEQHGSTRSSRRAPNVERVVSCRDVTGVTSQVEFGLTAAWGGCSEFRITESKRKDEAANGMGVQGGSKNVNRPLAITIN